MRSFLIASTLAAALSVLISGTARAADGWGNVKGQVMWGGSAPPAEEKVDTSKEPACAKCNVIKEEFVVGKNGGVKNVLVWLIDATDPKKPKAPPIHPSLKEVKEKEIVIDQPCCKFEPHVLAMREGQVLVGKNSAAFNHNMRWGGAENPGDNKLIPAGGQIKIEDLKACRVPMKVECNIHPWMNAYVGIFSHPYYAVTDADGKFEIKNAPAGKYNIVMWQEGKGWANGGKTGKEIEIPAGGTVEVNEKLVP